MEEGGRQPQPLSQIDICIAVRERLYCMLYRSCGCTATVMYHQTFAVQEVAVDRWMSWQHSWSVETVWQYSQLLYA